MILNPVVAHSSMQQKLGCVCVTVWIYSTREKVEREQHEGNEPSNTHIPFTTRYYTTRRRHFAQPIRVPNNSPSPQANHEREVREVDSKGRPIHGESNGQPCPCSQVLSTPLCLGLKERMAWRHPIGRDPTRLAHMWGGLPLLAFPGWASLVPATPVTRPP